MSRVLVIPGSRRHGSLNRQLAERATARLREAGAEVTLLDLGAYGLPLYDGDLEAAEGVPEAARRLRQLVAEHEALVFVTPEYNASVPPLLKNAIDWVSRPTDDGLPRNPWQGRLALLLSASPGALGGLRSQGHLRDILETLGVWLLPRGLAVGGAAKAFDEHGRLDDARESTLGELLQQLTEAAEQRRPVADAA